MPIVPAGFRRPGLRGRALAAALLAALATAACGGDGGQAPQPRSGVVDLILTTPNAGDLGAIVNIGTGTGTVSAASGFQAYTSDGSGSATVVFAGSTPFGPGEVRLGSFTMQDLSRVPAVTVSLAEVATADFQVRGGLAGYSLRLVPR